MLKLDFDMGPLMAKVDRIESAIKESIWPAAKAGSQVFYEEVQARAMSVGGFGLWGAIYQKSTKDSKEGVMGDLAVYHVSWRKQREKTNVKGAPNPDAGLPYSTIGFWIEFGRWQRYMVRTGEDGEWYTVKRPGMEGKPAPKRGASQAEKDAYWMPRKDEPVWHAPKSFLRSSHEAKKAEASQAAKDRIHQLVREKLA